MGKQIVCDLCEEIIFEAFNDTMYRVTVKKLQHRYDGYAPWVSKRKVEFCEDCAFALKTIANELEDKTT